VRQSRVGHSPSLSRTPLTCGNGKSKEARGNVASITAFRGDASDMQADNGFQEVSNMAISTGFAFPKEPGKPSSGDGANSESAHDPNTGQRIAGYKAPKPPAQLDTSGANGGLGQSEAGAADIAAWQRSKDQPGLGVGIVGNGSGGIHRRRRIGTETR